MKGDCNVLITVLQNRSVMPISQSRKTHGTARERKLPLDIRGKKTTKGKEPQEEEPAANYANYAKWARQGSFDAPIWRNSRNSRPVPASVPEFLFMALIRKRRC